MNYRGRFAPSPTGALHFGSLVAAFASWLRARTAGGAWLVRVEDLDPPREVPGAAEHQLQTLRAFGLESDEPVARQSGRAELYLRALQPLLDAGLAFECRCSRSDVASQGGVHRACVAGAAGRPAAIRARVPDIDVGFVDLLQGAQSQALAREVGDFVLWRVEGFASYQLAVVVDDAAQRISEVVRGCDLLDSTPRQLWLQRALGFASPAYLHVPLALDHEGRKLSKSLAALPIDDADPLPALRAAWAFLGQAPLAQASPDAFLRRAVEAFDVTRVPAVASLAV
jgi:glutamyl-Q tRNA(Asp) synthetase